MKVADILKQKGTLGEVMTVLPDETVDKLAHRFRLALVGAMPVSADGRRIDGIISERDLVHGMAEHGAAVLTMPVSKLMTRSVVTVTSEQTIAEVARLMTVRRIRHLPVVDSSGLTGMVSIGDVVKHRLTEMELEANVLQDLAIARG